MMGMIIRLRGLEMSGLSTLIVALFVHRVRAIALRLMAYVIFRVVATASAGEPTLGMAVSLIWNRVWYRVEDRLVHRYRLRNRNRLRHRDCLRHHQRYLLMNRDRDRLRHLDWHVFLDFH